MLCIFSASAGSCATVKKSANPPHPAPYPAPSSVPDPTPGPPLELESCVSPAEDQSRIKITPFDLIVPVDAPGNLKLKLTARAEQRLVGGFNPDLPGKKIVFSIAGQKAGEAITDANGQAMAEVSVAVRPDAVTCFEAEHEGFKMPGRIYTFRRTRPIFVTDVDEVISDLPELRVPLTNIPDNPAVSGSIDALRKLSGSMVILYLTARDDALANKTRSWLKFHGFPSGPLKVWNWTQANSFGTSRGAQTLYKLDYIKGLKSIFPNIVAGIGNRTGDAQACLQAGTKAFIRAPKEPRANFPQGTVFVESWAEVVEKLSGSF